MTTIESQFGGRLVVRDSGDGMREIVCEQSTVLFTLPFHRDALVGFLSDLLGRKVAAIIYEDELPEVMASGVYVQAKGNGLIYKDADLGNVWEEAYVHVAIARHIEARDAAAEEQERAEEAGVEALHNHLENAVRQPLFRGHARRAYELGARAPQGEDIDEQKRQAGVV